MSSLTHLLKDEFIQSGAVLTPADLLQTSSAVFPFDNINRADVHDPSIIAWGRGFLMTPTSHNSFVTLWASEDLVKWSPLGPVINETPDWLLKAIPEHRSVWAPAALRVQNKLRIYYCASRKFGANESYIGFIENEDFEEIKPQRGWVDHAPLFGSLPGRDNFNAIDPDVFIASDGRHWMVYGSYWQGIFMVELDPLTGYLKTKVEDALCVAKNPKSRDNAIEAPFIREHGGYFYLFANYGLAAQGVRSDYRIVVGRSKSITGPYVGFDGVPMVEGGHAPLLSSSPPMFGPGGGNLIQDNQGSWWLAYHFYNGDRHWHSDIWGRPTMQIRGLIWGDDGWPLPTLPAGVSFVRQSDVVTGEWLFQIAFGQPFRADLTRQGDISSQIRHGSWQTPKSQRLQFSLDADSAAIGPHNEGEIEATAILDPSNQFFVGRDQHGRIVRGIKLDAQVRFV